MAIAFDNSSSGRTASGTLLTIAHTVAGSNTLLLVWVQTFASTISGVTYNGVAMTQLISIADGSGVNLYLFYLLSPATGTHNISITGAANGEMIATNVSYSGVKQSAFPDSSNTKQIPGTGTTLSIATTVVANNCWIVGFTMAGSSTTPESISSDKTDRVGFSQPAGNRYFLDSDSNASVPTGSQTMVFTATKTPNAQDFTAALISIEPAAVASVARTNPGLLLMGAG